MAIFVSTKLIQIKKRAQYKGQVKQYLSEVRSCGGPEVWMLLLGRRHRCVHVSFGQRGHS